MIRRAPRSTRTDTLFPYTTLVRSRRLGSLQAAGPDRNSDTTVSNANFPEWSGPINDRLRTRTFCSPGNYMTMSLRFNEIIHQTQCEGSFSNSAEERRDGKECGSTCIDRGERLI